MSTSRNETMEYLCMQRQSRLHEVSIVIISTYVLICIRTPIIETSKGMAAAEFDNAPKEITEQYNREALGSMDPLVQKIAEVSLSCLAINKLG